MEFLPLLLAFLAPIALYCTALAVLNRRQHPVMVRGPWDFAALLFAASGLLLVIVPLLINRHFEGAFVDLALEQGAQSPDAFSLVTLWWLVWGGYYVLVFLAAALLMWARRGKTVVYNVNPPDFEEALDRALDRMKLQAERRGDRVVIGRAAAPVREGAALAAAVTADGPAPARRPAESSPAETAFAVEPFPALWNVTLHWADPGAALRGPLETELRAALGEVNSDENPVGGWLMGVSGFLLALVFLTVMGLILSTFFPLPR